MEQIMNMRSSPLFRSVGHCDIGSFLVNAVAMPGFVVSVRPISITPNPQPHMIMIGRERR
jgi:hypothetical protein